MAQKKSKIKLSRERKIILKVLRGMPKLALQRKKSAQKKKKLLLAFENFVKTLKVDL